MLFAWLCLKLATVTEKDFGLKASQPHVVFDITVLKKILLGIILAFPFYIYTFHFLFDSLGPELQRRFEGDFSGVSSKHLSKSSLHAAPSRARSIPVFCERCSEFRRECFKTDVFEDHSYTGALKRKRMPLNTLGWSKWEGFLVYFKLYSVCIGRP